MTSAVFAVTIFAQLLLGGSLIVTLAAPPMRVWPPPQRRSWQYVYTWGLTVVSFSGVLALGLLDWNSFVLDHWIRFVVGGVLTGVGFVLVLWSIRTLGVYASQGLGGELIETGPYALSRNPQYVADIAILVGFAILANSTLTWATALLAAIWFVLAPFTEEPWLRQRFGTRYDPYAARVPRYVALSLRRRA